MRAGKERKKERKRKVGEGYREEVPLSETKPPMCILASGYLLLYPNLSFSLNSIGMMETGFELYSKCKYELTSEGRDVLTQLRPKKL